MSFPRSDRGEIFAVYGDLATSSSCIERETLGIHLPDERTSMTKMRAPQPNVFGLPDSDIALAATEFTLRSAPEFIYNHSVRSYLFAREVAAASGMRAGEDYDEELVYLSCVLHDIGATDQANGDQRFEVDGADAAAAFLRRHDIDEDRITPVWTAIALHTSPGLAHRFGTVPAVAQMGIGTDIIGLGKGLLPNGFAERVHERWPRHNLGYRLAAVIARQVHDKPAKGDPLSFPGHLHQLVYPGSPSITWFDVVDAAGWGDKWESAL
jgi:hypothetical protein